MDFIDPKLGFVLLYIMHYGDTVSPILSKPQVPEMPCHTPPFYRRAYNTRHVRHLLSKHTSNICEPSFGKMGFTVPF